MLAMRAMGVQYWASSFGDQAFSVFAGHFTLMQALRDPNYPNTRDMSRRGSTSDQQPLHGCALHIAAARYELEMAGVACDFQ